MKTDAIVLNGFDPPRRVAPEDVHFAFGSGRFGYDCVSCGARCCRGFGYRMGRPEEVSTQLERRPSLRLFLEPVGGDGVASMRNLAPGCFFLSEDGLCGIHAAHGYAAKPETCRLFPFNWLRLVGPHLIVAPHTSLCPLEILRPPATSDCSSHATLASGLAEAPIAGRVQELPVGDAAAARRLVELERRIRDAGVEPDAGYARFAARQVEITSALFRPEGPLSPEEAEQTIRRFLAALEEVLAISVPNDAASSAILIAATPALRVQTQYAGVASDGTRTPALAIGRLPQMLCVLHLLAQAAHDAGMARITFQTLGGMLKSFGPVMRVLAYADVAMQWHPDSALPWPRRLAAGLDSKYLDVVQALLRGDRGLTLGQVLSQAAPAEEVERVLFVKEICGHLDGRIVPVGRTPPARRKWMGRDALKRATLRVAPRPLLASVAGAATAPAARRRTSS